MNAVLSSQAATGLRFIPADIGLALSPEHPEWVLDRELAAAWFEVRADGLMARGDWLRKVEAVSRTQPLWLHSVGLSVGSVSPPQSTYLDRLRELITRLEPDIVSDHLSWSTVDGVHLPGLMPLPYTEEALSAVIGNVIHVQDRLKRRLVLENPAGCVDVPGARLAEESFLAEVVLRTGCGVALNLRNLRLKAAHLDLAPGTLLGRFVEALEPDSILAMRLAASDTQAWKLFQTLVETIGPVPTLLEWSATAPSFDTVRERLVAARSILLGERTAVEAHVVIA